MFHQSTYSPQMYNNSIIKTCIFLHENSQSFRVSYVQNTLNSTLTMKNYKDSQAENTPLHVIDNLD